MKYLVYIFIIAIVSCKSEKFIYEESRFENIGNLEIRQAIEYEKSQKTENTTTKHKIGIGKGIYPNENNFELETPISSNRSIRGKFELQTKYFYSKKDNLVKVILYEWHIPKESHFLIQINKAKNKRKFDKKYKMIENEIIKILGKPDVIALNKDQFPYTRDERKWLQRNNTKAYLFKGNHEPSGHYHIELAIYRE